MQKRRPTRNEKEQNLREPRGGCNFKCSQYQNRITQIREASQVQEKTDTDALLNMQELSSYHKIVSSTFFIREIKFIILRQDKKNKYFLLSFGLLSLPTVHYVSALCINRNFPIGRNTCSIINSNILLASMRQLLRDNIPS